MAARVAPRQGKRRQPLLAFALAGLGATGAAAASADDRGAACRALLGRLEGRDDFELHALCRAELPTGACREALRSLGARPWQQERVEATCEQWLISWPRDEVARVLDDARQLDDLSSKTTTHVPGGYRFGAREAQYTAGADLEGTVAPKTTTVTTTPGAGRQSKALAAIGKEGHARTTEKLPDGKHKKDKKKNKSPSPPPPPPPLPKFQVPILRMPTMPPLPKLLKLPPPTPAPKAPKPPAVPKALELLARAPEPPPPPKAPEPPKAPKAPKAPKPPPPPPPPVAPLLTSTGKQAYAPPDQPTLGMRRHKDLGLGPEDPDATHFREPADPPVAAPAAPTDAPFPPPAAPTDAPFPPPAAPTDAPFPPPATQRSQERSEARKAKRAAETAESASAPQPAETAGEAPTTAEVLSEQLSEAYEAPVKAAEEATTATRRSKIAARKAAALARREAESAAREEARKAASAAADEFEEKYEHAPRQPEFLAAAGHMPAVACGLAMAALAASGVMLTVRRRLRRAEGDEEETTRLLDVEGHGATCSPAE